MVVKDCSMSGYDSNKLKLFVERKSSADRFKRPKKNEPVLPYYSNKVQCESQTNSMCSWIDCQWKL